MTLTVNQASRAPVTSKGNHLDWLVGESQYLPRYLMDRPFLGERQRS
jgi:hypothetical protein